MNIPNFLTSLRLVFPIILCIIFLLDFNDYYEKNLILIIFIILSVTDYFDGLFARMFNQESVFGKIFDPISDKILTSSTLVYILTFDRSILIPTILIISREFIVSGNREYMLKLNSNQIDVTFISKIKTSLQFISISLFLAQNLLIKYVNINYIALTFLWLATVLTIYTGYQYSYITYTSNNKRK